MHGELPGAASAFLSVASRVEVAAFFRYLREDVSQVDDDDLQAVFQLAFRHLLVLAHRALGVSSFPNEAFWVGLVSKCFFLAEERRQAEMRETEQDE